MLKAILTALLVIALMALLARIAALALPAGLIWGVLWLMHGRRLTR